MKNYPDELSEEIALERWENEGGEVKTFPEVRMNPEVRTNDKAILICIGCLVVLPFFYWLVKRLGK